MAKVAVAGGTGGIGKHIVEGLLETKKHDVIVLSRKSSCPELEKLGVQIIAVSYDDPSSVERALVGVHTIISGIDRSQLVAPQLALIEAGKKVGVKRFVPSEWIARGIKNDVVEAYALKAEVAEAVKASGMEYTIFENGLFMNFLASGTLGIGHLHPLKYIVDVENCKANVPGDGESYVVWTRAEDVGRFVAASLELDVWPEVCRMMGGRETLNDLVKEAEAVRGKRFEVTYTPVEEIKKQIRPEDPSARFTNPLNQSLLMVAESDRVAFNDANLNTVCPQIVPVGIREFLETWWKTV